jgi:mannitol-specific phosphotransferase system IIBC component
MYETTWVFVGVVSVLATIGALLTDDNGMAILTGILGFVAWGIWTFGALNIEIITDSGVVLTKSNPAAAILGVALALIPGFIALTGPVEIVSRVRDTRMDEV